MDNQNSTPNMTSIRQLWPFEVEPREVQLEALAAGLGKPGFAYFMRQRLGKTWTAFAEFIILRSQGKVDWCVIIAPNSIKDQWREQIEEVYPFIPICIYASQKKGKFRYFFDKNKKGGVLIINYESLRPFTLELEMYSLQGDPLFDPKRTYLVADESTKIKDPKSKMCKAALGFANDCAYVRVLSGRPTANSNADMWSQLKFIRATELNFHQHKHRYVLMGGYQGRQVLKNVNTDHLKWCMKPHCYIAPDKYVTGFKKSYEPMRRVNLTSNLQDMYKRMEDDLIFDLTSDTKITAPIALTRYLRLQQISSGIAGDEDGNQHNLVEPENNPRIRVVRDILDNEIDHKVIIPCRFRLSMKNLYEMLIKDGYKCSVIMGNMGSERIELEKKKFNEGDNNIMLAQLQVLSFGHTLPGPDDNPCDSMIYYENDFSLLNRMQSESRPEKYGRDIPISYYDMYASKMDRHMLTALIRKDRAGLDLMGYAKTMGLRPDLSETPSKTEEEDNARLDPILELLSTEEEADIFE